MYGPRGGNDGGQTIGRRSRAARESARLMGPAGERAADGAWQFYVDRGGTFTDVVGRAPDGALSCLKLLSEAPGRYADAASEGIRRLLEQHGAHGRQVSRVRVGTTVATNALLERSGASTTFVVTHGFEDLLSIGTQERPHLFRRRIELPAPLYAQVIGARERVTAEGEVLIALDETALGRALAQARAGGSTAIAIAFLHGWRYPQHEQRAAELARAAGFTEVAVSHEVLPLERIIARADTTVADAYLTPVLGAYVAGLSRALRALVPEARVEFMTSHGGLADAGALRGVAALLSGPAGGLVGMAAVGRACGATRLVGFDMGGTSTDVSLYHGEFPRRYETRVAGVRIHGPMLDIHTVAAGGGSLLSYQDGRYRVGPESAGALPGPACYGRGGPLAVTDIHVVLGRLRAECFPRLFGPGGDGPLDDEPARRQFAALARQIAAAEGTELSTEAVAEGFLTVAVETMAGAIKEVTLGAGHDPADHTLVCFGGAAGQHACRVADALGMRAILIHPLAGVLSALGIGLAERRAVRRATLGAPLDAAGRERAEALATTLGAAVRAKVESGDAGAPAELAGRAELRLDGAETTLSVPLADLTAMRAAFVTAHRQRYGYLPEPRAALVIEAVTVEAVRPEQVAVDARLPPSAAEPRSVTAWFDGRACQVPLIERATLAPGTELAGPAILAEPTATTVIEIGWSARVLSGGELLLERRDAPKRRHIDATRVDGATLEVFHALFAHAAEQMGVVLRQAASSVNIRERLDYSCALFDADGALIANAPHMPVHLGSMGASVRAVMARHGPQLAAGDSYLLNSPYAGGTHLPDLTVVTPVFVAGPRPEFWVASRAHHADVGGITPGSMPPFSTRIDQEGALFEGERIVHRGRLDSLWLRKRLARGPHPARAIERNLADLAAQLAANARGAHELKRLCQLYGLPVVSTYMKHVQDNAETTVRAAIRALDIAGAAPAGNALVLDGGERIEVSVRADRISGGAEVDFAGTSATSPRNFNAPLAVCTAAVLYVFRTLVEAEIPLNEGCLRPIRLTVPARSLLSPAAPAAVVAGNVETSQCIVDALYGALGVLAGSQGTMNNVTFGNARYQYYETIAGGAGAGPGFAGASGVHTHMTNSRLTDPEVLEARLPVLVREFRYRRGSGGGGRWRGGDGLVRVLEFRTALEVAILSNHRSHGPQGAHGGAPGAAGRNVWQRADGGETDLGATGAFAAGAGDRLIIETPGGGGYGSAAAC
jgi:5-oxoprolinase (ATP-hydrolysing)